MAFVDKTAAENYLKSWGPSHGYTQAQLDALLPQLYKYGVTNPGGRLVGSPNGTGATWKPEFGYGYSLAGLDSLYQDKVNKTVLPPIGTTPTTTTPTTTTPAAHVETAAEKEARLKKAAIDAARTKGTSEFTRLFGNTGLTNDTFGLGTEFTRLLNDALSKVGSDWKNIGKYVNYEDLFNKAKTAETGAQSNKLTQAYNTATPTGWQTTAIPDTADDPYLLNVLTGQATDQLNTLKRQLDSGQISTAQYNYAVDQLGYNAADPSKSTNLSAGAYSQLQTLGGGLLSGYRNDLGSIMDDFSKAVSNYSLGQNVDPNYYTGQVAAKTASYLDPTALSGAIKSTLGDTKLFDPNKLVASAGNAVGVSNQPVTGSNPQGTGSIPSEQDKRTIGTSGVF